MEEWLTLGLGASTLSWACYFPAFSAQKFPSLVLPQFPPLQWIIVLPFWIDRLQIKLFNTCLEQCLPHNQPSVNIISCSIIIVAFFPLFFCFCHLHKVGSGNLLGIYGFFFSPNRTYQRPWEHQSVLGSQWVARIAYHCQSHSKNSHFFFFRVDVFGSIKKKKLISI